MSVITEIGNVPWTLNDIKESYQEFKELYKQRPVPDNFSGMRAPHAFACWFMVRYLQPELIIESGVWKGQGTWLIEKACPDSQLICLDIDLNQLVYRSQKAVYHEEDFSTVNFCDHDKANALCFFDDHQNALMRMQQMNWKGFRSAIFDDNYPKLRGDCYSLKKIFGGHGFKQEAVPIQSLKHKIKSCFINFIDNKPDETIEANSTHLKELQLNLKTYYEFPPLFKEEMTRWDDEWDSENYPTKPALFDIDDADELRTESRYYTWMCYVELK